MNFENTGLQWQWITLDPSIEDSYIPCLFRNDEKYILIQTIKELILKYYDNKFSIEINLFEPLVSFDCSQAELNLLNDININHALNKYGTRAFTFEDKLVRLDHFLEHYELMKKAYKQNLISIQTISPMSNSISRPFIFETNNELKVNFDRQQLFDDPIHNDNSQFSLIQVNDFILVLIELDDLFYQFNQLFPKCHYYVILDDLVKIGLAKRDDLKNYAKKIKASDKLVHYKKWLNKKLNKNSEEHLNQTIEIINIQEAQFMCFDRPIYFKKITKMFEFTENYEFLFGMTGGLIMIKEQIVPFFRLNQDYFLISDDRLSFGASDKINLNIPRIFEFFQLLKLYSSIQSNENERNYFVNIKKYLQMDPKNYKIICEFNPGFPNTWIDDLKKYVNNTMSDYNSATLSPISYQDEIIKPLNLEFNEDCIFKHEELNVPKLLKSFSETCLCVAKFNASFRLQTKKPSRKIKLMRSLSSNDIKIREPKEEIDQKLNTKIHKRLKRLFRNREPIKIKSEKIDNPINVSITINEKDKIKNSNYLKKRRSESKIDKISDKDFVVPDNKIIKLSPNEKFNFNKKKSEPKNILSIKQKDEIYSADDFDVEFYIKKYKIIPCQVKIHRLNLKISKFIRSKY